MNYYIHLLRCFLLLVFINSFTGCSINNDEMNPNENEENNIADTKSISSTDIKGIWVNTVVYWDTIRISDFIINRWNYISNSYFNYYEYTIEYDSIFLNYTGLYKVSLPPYHRRLFLNDKKDTLIIENFHKVFPDYQGDIFIKISN
jgi:hypothetical protein